MNSADITLYDYWRSSAAWRVRIGLNLKGVAYRSQPVHLVREGGEQHRPEYRAINPAGLVPTLLHGQRRITQSLAILEYLDEAFPGHPHLLPEDVRGRARVRALALTLAADTHPIHNLRVQQYLKNTMGLDEDAVAAFVRHWLLEGFTSFEALLASSSETGSFCHGDHPTLADCVLVPAMYAARRFGAPLDDFGNCLRIHDQCSSLPAFQAAHPDRQPDAPAA
ncbi:maleylacetoacetate isomerase [Pseudofulvimonas gallinarii]|uniref:Maleylacetoacetate isomerase n=1 Tax=Pseudofulvimonas gallinarii TaxID=634155 RepID=A0A4R3LEU5_9GAMM|nr:maleylacetoacetate isomerase [Pseudofulvimonas gallinarii]TCS97945.1 maleylacetoacetate isomerase [Pseudofulvimonas gallinarii]THD13101.1 maleylacetoacetate isomerase [Pseudofulvimonas gallinarii]